LSEFGCGLKEKIIIVLELKMKELLQNDNLLQQPFLVRPAWAQSKR